MLLNLPERIYLQDWLYSRYTGTHIFQVHSHCYPWQYWYVAYYHLEADISSHFHKYSWRPLNLHWSIASFHLGIGTKWRSHYWYHWNLPQSEICLSMKLEYGNENGQLLRHLWVAQDCNCCRNSAWDGEEVLKQELCMQHSPFLYQNNNSMKWSKITELHPWSLRSNSNSCMGCRSKCAWAWCFAIVRIYTYIYIYYI